ncbi:hypothetical protein [Burkholderia sp. Ac-20365]|uniref:hypothetical protein n=1 Tax=Burkholderia sp. Ac-20365 TaxID=2703897 RepID=UPI00197BBD2A|nr:hypothetical protein [Burkholderia sp. Ac-20365]MBN3761207.1 hypothetical protein [Burkholderia sp. Ac-20365]
MADKLQTLQVSGKISPCNLGVQVSQQKIGATVTLLAYPKGGTPRVIGGGVATWTSQAIPLDPGVMLTPNVDSIFALQDWAGSGYASSDPSNYVTVVPAPSNADISSGTFSGPLYVCAGCVRLAGAFPYANVILKNAGGELLSADDGIVGADGVADVRLRRTLKQTDGFLRATLTGCNGVQGTIQSSRIVAPPVSLPQPSIQSPAVCSPVLLCDGLTPGGQVFITRAGQEFVACAPAPSVAIRLPPLSPPTPNDNELHVQEVFGPPCNVKTIPVIDVPIRASAQPPTFGSTPVCAGDLSLDLQSLEVGGELEISLPGGDRILGGIVASGMIARVPALAEGTVQVRQNLCGDPNTWSPVAQIVVGGRIPLPPLPTYPANEQKGVDLRGPLRWIPGPATPCNAAQAFWVQVSTIEDFKKAIKQKLVIRDVQIITGHSWTFYSGAALPSNTQLFWRVAAQTGPQSGEWSAVWSFTTKLESPVTGDPPVPPEVSKDFQFVEDCCGVGAGGFRRIIWVAASSYADALKQAEANTLNGCRIIDFDPTDPSQVAPCDNP